MIIHVDTLNFEKEVLQSKSLVIMDFFAEWCMPCRMMAPIFERLSEEYKKNVKFCKINTDENQKLAEEFKIQGIPTLIIVKGNKELKRMVGFCPEDLLRQEIDKVVKNLKNSK